MDRREKFVIDAFHNLYYDGLGEGRIYERTYWMNYTMFEMPPGYVDLSEIIAEIKPDLIIETGTFLGFPEHIPASQ